MPLSAPIWCRQRTLNYQPVLDALSTSVFVLDDRCRVDYLNESAESLVDESLTRLRGQEIGEILELAYANEAETCSKNSAATGPK
jgi:nitrogen-specific signal transduction histidine kinase